MTEFDFWALSVGLVALFWAVGAVSRLSRLRAQVLHAYNLLDQGLTRYVLWIQSCLPDDIRTDFATMPAGLEMPNSSDAPWSRLQACLNQYLQAMLQARSAPMDAQTLAALVLAHSTLVDAWLGAMFEQHSEDAEQAQRRQLRCARMLSQCVPLRDAFNQAANHYNRAIKQFPVLLLARVLRFRPAGNLLRLALEP